MSSKSSRTLSSLGRPVGTLAGRLASRTGPGNSSAVNNLWWNNDQRDFQTTLQVSKDYPEHMLLPMPALSPTMEMGTIAKWVLKEGDSFGAGSVICSVETDKATMDFEAQDDGVIAKILKDGANAVDIPIGAAIAIVVDNQDDVAAFADFVLEEGTPAIVPTTASESVAAVTPPPAPTTTRDVSDEFVLLPSARFLAESK